MQGSSRDTRARLIVVVSLSTVGAVALVICALLQKSQLDVQPWRHLGSNSLGDLPSVDDPHWRAWLQESRIRVSAIVFYGRKRYVQVVEGYLKRNLVSAGGLLEEVRAQFAQNLCIGNVYGVARPRVQCAACMQVVWMVQTDDAADVQWLQEVLLPSRPESYKAVWPTGKLYMHSSTRIQL